MHTQKKRRIRADLIVIAALLLLAGVLFLVLRGGHKQGAFAVVRVDGVETERHLLSEDGIFLLNDGTNILMIHDGKACISAASCPDHVCMDQGDIQKTNEVITCLPNRLTVTIENGERNDVDSVVGR